MMHDVESYERFEATYVVWITQIALKMLSVAFRILPGWAHRGCYDATLAAVYFCGRVVGRCYRSTRGIGSWFQ